jgi:DNA-binding transcriptional regulator YhcF (GntR family)
VAPGDTIEAVRALAAKHGVSERTAWRWLAQMRLDGSPELLEQKRRRQTCLACGAALPPEATIRRRYCDGECRISHYRHRKAAEQRAKRRSAS